MISLSESFALKTSKPKAKINRQNKVTHILTDWEVKIVFN